MPWDYNYWVDIFGRVLTEITAWLPSLLAGAGILVIGLLAAAASRALFTGLLRRLGFDRLAERVGVSRALREIGAESPPAEFIARIVYWLILFFFILAAAESFGIGGVREALQGIVAYLPRFAAALLIMIFGGVIARLTGNAFGSLTERSGIRGGLALGHGLRYVLLVFVAVIAIGQLGVETTLLVATATALIGCIAVALAVAFGWGSREIARNVMAGFHVRDTFIVGQRLTVRGRTGRLVAIGNVKTLLETEEGTVSLPNSILTEEEVTIHPEGVGGP